jgi:diguanylate cyclase (GGDEF)-like protein/PAS domain S-box-containing protein
MRMTRSIPGLFGLTDAENAWVADARLAQFRAAAVGLPSALVAQIIAAGLLAGMALAETGSGGLTIGMWTGLGLVAGALLYLILSGRALGKRPLRLRIAATLVLTAAIGSAQALLLWEATHVPLDRAATACIVAISLSMFINGAALLPVRIAVLAYAAAALAVLLPISGMTAASAAGALFLALFAAMLYLLARSDLDEADGRAQAEDASMLAQRLVREHEDQGTGWFWVTDRRGRLTYLSEPIVKEIGIPADQIVGRPLTEIFEMDSAAADTERTLTFHLSSRTSFSGYSVQPAGRNSDRWWAISGRPIVDKIGQYRGFIGSGSDLTAKRQSEAEITRLALFDSLTGLANRQRMRLSLDQSLAQQGGPYRPTSLFLLDLDRFKAVNDTLGHQIGDELLKQVAQRLQRCLGEAGLVGRLGGDEFKIVLPGENNRERLAELAKGVIASLSHPYAISGSSISIGCSVGIAVAPDDGENSETLIRNADLALYAAKADGRGVHRFYREEMLAGAQSRRMLEDDLRRAIAEGQFHLAYQPVVSTLEAKIVGFEALIRWQHPTRGLISPAEFIPVAEECGLIERIGEWVLRTACDEAAKWPDCVRIGVNVSTIQFASPGLPALVMNVLANSGLAPDRLELEITESVFLNDCASSDQMFARLKALGIRLALDDFGTGYSSLGYLKTAPFDKIKIDQSFVRGAAIAGSRNAAIIKAIVTLANTLGMETTAEGVEIQDEIALIRELGCSHIQGFVYGRPMPAEDVLPLITGQGGSASASGHKTSRPPRTKMLRSANLEAGGLQRQVLIRNMSSTGALIDGIGDAEVTPEVLIELLDGQMFRAFLRWMRNGKAGLQFAEPFDMGRLKTSGESRSIRRTA